MAIGGLMLLRLAVRLFSKTPPTADTGYSALNSCARWAHVALYALVFVMVACGLATATSADLFTIAFGGSGAQLPVTFEGISARTAHAVVGKLLLLMIGLHVLGWAYHQFVLKDRLFSRMWFGRRSAE